MAASLNTIPEEILHYICNLLETKDKLRLACVCQRLRKTLSSRMLNKKASFKNNWHVPQTVIQMYVKKNSEYLLHLDLQNCYWLKQPQLTQCLLRCTNLISLDVSGCSVSQNNVFLLMEKCNKLKHFGWTIDKKTYDDVKELDFTEVPVSIKRLHLYFQKLSSLKLASYHVRRQIPDNATIVLFKILLSKLCLQCLELELLMIGQYVACPFRIHVAVETLVKGRAIASNSYPHAIYMNKCFPLSTTETVILPLLPTNAIFPAFYWSDAQSNGQFDGPLPQALKNLDLSRTKFMGVSKENICKLLSCPSLEYIKIGVEEFSSEELLFICSSVLESLSLKDSYSLDSEFYVLENLSEKCPRLKHINLLNIHVSWHCSHDHSSRFIKAISSIKTLVSLAVNPCCIKTNTGEEIPALQSISKEVNKPFTLTTLVQSCKHMTEFELIDSTFQSDIVKHEKFSSSRQPSSVSSKITLTLSSATLSCMSHWKHLQKLTLAGFQVSGGDFFIVIFKECTELKSLSLAQLKGPSLSHSGNVACLNKALTHCHNLKDFRLEQPYFDITRGFLNALHNAKTLERVCVMVNHGKLAVDEIEPWLNKCSKVIFVQIFCDVTMKMCKTLKKCLESKYGPHRPGFTVDFFVYDNDTTSRLPILGDQSPRNNTPLVHLQEMTLFASRVASSHKPR